MHCLWRLLGCVLVFCLGYRCWDRWWWCKEELLVVLGPVLACFLVTFPNWVMRQISCRKTWQSSKHFAGTVGRAVMPFAGLSCDNMLLAHYGLDMREVDERGRQVKHWHRPREFFFFFFFFFSKEDVLESREWNKVAWLGDGAPLSHSYNAFLLCRPYLFLSEGPTISSSEWPVLFSQQKQKQKPCPDPWAVVSCSLV